MLLYAYLVDYAINTILWNFNPALMKLIFFNLETKQQGTQDVWDIVHLSNILLGYIDREVD